MQLGVILEGQTENGSHRLAVHLRRDGKVGCILSGCIADQRISIYIIFLDIKVVAVRDEIGTAICNRDLL